MFNYKHDLHQNYAVRYLDPTFGLSILQDIVMLCLKRLWNRLISTKSLIFSAWTLGRFYAGIVWSKNKPKFFLKWVFAVFIFTLLWAPFDGYFAQFLAKILMESSLNLSPNVSVFSTHKYLLKLHKVYSSKYRGNNTQ